MNGLLFNNVGVGEMSIRIGVMDQKPKLDGGQAITKDYVFLVCILSLKSGDALSLYLIEFGRIGIEHTDSHRPLVDYLGNLLIQLMDILRTEKTGSNTNLDIEDIMKV